MAVVSPSRLISKQGGDGITLDSSSRYESISATGLLLSWLLLAIALATISSVYWSFKKVWRTTTWTLGFPICYSILEVINAEWISVKITIFLFITFSHYTKLDSKVKACFTPACLNRILYYSFAHYNYVHLSKPILLVPDCNHCLGIGFIMEISTKEFTANDFAVGIHILDMHSIWRDQTPPQRDRRWRSSSSLQGSVCALPSTTWHRQTMCTTINNAPLKPSFWGYFHLYVWSYLVPGHKETAWPMLPLSVGLKNGF